VVHATSACPAFGQYSQTSLPATQREPRRHRGRATFDWCNSRAARSPNSFRIDDQGRATGAKPRPRVCFSMRTTILGAQRIRWNSHKSWDENDGGDRGRSCRGPACGSDGFTAKPACTARRDSTRLQRTVLPGQESGRKFGACVQIVWGIPSTCDGGYFLTRPVTTFTAYAVFDSSCAGSGKRSLINVWFDPDVDASGSANQTMQK
jgi:hypothetical protein